MLMATSTAPLGLDYMATPKVGGGLWSTVICMERERVCLGAGGISLITLKGESSVYISAWENGTTFDVIIV